MPDYKNSDMCRCIDEYIRNPRYRSILKLRYCESETYERIAEKVAYDGKYRENTCNQSEA